MSNKSRNLVGTIIGVVSATLVLLFTAWVILNRQYVLDHLTMWSYTPNAAVSAISQRAAMSDEGRFYFYASQPKVETADEFNASCVRQEASSAILGCYSNKRIYIYDVPNQELNGVEEVTAAHETLHAVWERMSETEKTTLSNKLEEAFAKINDTKLNDRMAYYDRTEPGERANELHSILGTEYAQLGSVLEAHYRKYFTDRNTVVSLYSNYQAIFDNLKAQSDALAAQMGTLKTAINKKTAEYNAEVVSINNDAIALKNSADSVDRTSASAVNAYNARRQVLLNRIDALEILRKEINAQTETYNAKVAEYNKLVVSTNELNKSLDSTLSPAPSL